MPARWLALGDSYTSAEGVAETDGWSARAAATLAADGTPVVVERIARTGWSCDELAAGIDAAAPQGPYRLVTLLVGVNDQYRGHPLDHYRPRYARLLQRALAFADRQAERVLALSIPDWGVTPFARAGGHDPAAIARALDAYNIEASRQCLDAGVAFVDLTTCSRSLGDGPGMLANDGLHPGPAQHAAWAALALPALRRALAGPA